MRVFLLLFLSYFCFSQDFSKTDYEIMRNAKKLETKTFCSSENGMFNYHSSTWIDSSDITYSIKNYPSFYTKDSIRKILEDVFLEYSTVINKPIKEIFTDSDIQIEFEFVDGIDNILGYSGFPPSSINAQKPLKIVIDKYDILPIILLIDNKDSLQKNKNLEIIIKHEVGHALGMFHNNVKQSIMYKYYDDEKVKMCNHDKIIFKTAYDHYSPFLTEDVKYFVVTNNTKYISKYFKESEFFTKCGNYKKHYLDTTLVWAISKIREYYQTPVTIISSFRDYDCNIRAGGARSSKHLDAQAIDFKFLNPKKHKQYQKDIRNKRGVYAILKKRIKGYGLYKTSNHIDTRSTFTMWESMNKNLIVNGFETEDIYEGTEH